MKSYLELLTHYTLPLILLLIATILGLIGSFTIDYQIVKISAIFTISGTLIFMYKLNKYQGV